MSWETLLAKFGIETVKGSFRVIRGSVSESRYRELVSAAVAELLQLDPDINAAEANILAVEALGRPPSRELLNAKEPPGKVKSSREKPKRKLATKAARKKGVKKKATAKKAAKKKAAKKR
jgi:hypothetical protein